MIEAAPDMFLACREMMDRMRETLGKAIGKEGRSVCDNCGKTWLWESLNHIEGYDERVDPGGAEPDGQCPDGGALCYEADEGELATSDRSPPAVFVS